MATIEDLAKQYAEQIATATSSDKRSRTAGLLKEAEAIAKRSQTVVALKSVAKEIDGLTYVTSKEPISEEDKDRLIDSIAESLGLAKSDQLKRGLKQASIDNGMVVVREIEDIINSAK